VQIAALNHANLKLNRRGWATDVQSIARLAAADLHAMLFTFCSELCMITSVRKKTHTTRAATARVPQQFQQRGRVSCSESILQQAAALKRIADADCKDNAAKCSIYMAKWGPRCLPSRLRLNFDLLGKLKASLSPINRDS
jgi:hypothetical protein